MGWVAWTWAKVTCPWPQRISVGGLADFSDHVSPMRSQTDNAVYVFVTCTYVLSYTCVYKVPTANYPPSGPPWVPEVCNIVIVFL